MTSCPLPLLPGISWNDTAHVVNATGNRLRRWGSVQKACEILDGCDREVIYALRDSGDIVAYKPNARAKNGHLKVDLLSVWEHRQRQLKQA